MWDIHTFLSGNWRVDVLLEYSGHTVKMSFFLLSDLHDIGLWHRYLHQIRLKIIWTLVTKFYLLLAKKDIFIKKMQKWQFLTEFRKMLFEKVFFCNFIII